MTKKTFIALADAMRLVRERLEVGAPTFGDKSDYMLGAREQWQYDVRALADFCASQNAKFKRDRWLAYINGDCGPNGGKAAGK